MFGGQTRVPLVAREPVGMWRASAAQHSQSLEAWYAHIPGLVVVMPATPADNRGLLASAIRSDDPVVYMEHKGLWTMEGDVPEGDHLEPLGKAAVSRPGTDLTIITWSATVTTCLEAAQLLHEGAGINCEVIDLRTLWPWDQDTVLASVARTKRALVVHEAVQVGGFGAEIAAVISEQLFDTLSGPVARLGAPRAPIAYSPPLEAQVTISAEKVGAKVRSMLD